MSEKKKEIACPVKSTLENELLGIDEEKLPLVLSERLELLEKTNRAYDVAKIREKEARDKVAAVLTKADALITEAKNAGKNTATTHSFLGFEWTNKSDEIEALQKNLQKMVECGIESAEAQKELVEVQSALAESQESILQVQEIQMAYQGQIADATKFLYGLSAYNMSSIQSVLINLEAVLSGASKEKLGEMAQQQLLLAMDQLKNQENIILGIRENRKRIDNIDSIVAVQGEDIDKISRKNSEQDARLEKLENTDKDLVKEGRERDKLLQAGDEHDKKQDLEIAAQAKKNEEHDRLLQAGEEHDKKQDLELVARAKKDEEHDRLLQAGKEHDKKQDLELAARAKKDEEHDKKIKDLLERCTEIQEKADEQAKIISQLKNEIEGINENKAGKRGMLVAYAIAGVSLLLTLIQFFI